MKRNIKSKIFTLSLAFSALALFSCGDISEDSENTAVVKATQGEKAVISVSVENENARTALPNYDKADFDSFTLEGWKDTTNGGATKTWSWDSYDELKAFHDEVEVGTWKFVLTGTKNGTKYTGTITGKEVSTSNPNTALSFTLALSELSATGTGTVEITANANGVAKTEATISVKSGQTIALPEGYAATKDLSSGTVSFESLAPGYYSILLKFYADSSKELLIGRMVESAIVTGGGTSKSTIQLGDLDSAHSISYYDGDGAVLTGLSPVSYTRFNSVTLPVPTKTGFVFGGWYERQADLSQTNSLLVATNTTRVTGIEANNVDNKTYYAKFISNDEAAALTKVTIASENTNGFKVGEVLTANAFTGENGSTAFAGEIASYAWYVGTKADGATEITWGDSASGTASTYTPSAEDLDKYIKVEITRKYKVTETSADSGIYDIAEATVSDKVSSTDEYVIGKGTLASVSASDLAEVSLTYNNGTAVVAGSALDSSKLSLSAGGLKVKNANNEEVEVSVTPKFATGATAPATSTAAGVKVLLTAAGYNDLEVTDALKINVKAASPVETVTSALLSNSAATIAKGYVKFASANTTLEYNTSVTSNTAANSSSDWSDIDPAVEFPKPANLFVRVKATGTASEYDTSDYVAPSDAVAVAIADANVGTLEKLVKVVFSQLNGSAITDKSVVQYGDTVTVVPQSSEVDENSGLTYKKITDSTITYVWTAVGETDDETVTLGSTNEASLKLSGSYAVTAVGKLLKVKVVQTVGESTYEASETYGSVIALGTLAQAEGKSLVYKGGNTVVVGTPLDLDNLSISGSTDSAKEKIAVNQNSEEVTVSFSCATTTVPDANGSLEITASAAGYKSLTLNAAISVKGATPTSDDLNLWLDSTIASITKGYVLFKEKAVESRLEYSTDGSTWTRIEAKEYAPKGTNFYLRVGEKTDEETPATVLVAASDSSVNLYSNVFSATYLGTRSVNVVISGNDNRELVITKSGTNALVVSAAAAITDGSSSNTAITDISWSVVDIDDDITSQVADVSTSTDGLTNDTLTFKDSVTKGSVYNVTVTAKRGDVTLTSSFNITIE